MKRIFVFLSLLILFSSGTLAATFSNPSSNWQSNQPTFDNLYAGDFSSYWPILSDMKDGQCNATTDFVIGIPPGGCSPTVVTSDLLAEQNVPVFCELYAIKINPLIKVSSIKSISFKGDYPDGVRSVVYHPARAAVKSYSTLLGDPQLENIGYVVIILSQNKVEANMTEWIAGNLTATMTYDAEEAYGTGKGEYYLEPVSDGEWDRNYMENSFWNGRGFLRVLDVSDGQAKIQVMRDQDSVFRTLTLKEGETSSSSYLPGFYCKAGLKVKLTDIMTQEDMARLNIDGENIWVRKGTKFLDDKCSVSKLVVNGNNNGNITISCSGAGKINPLELSGIKVLLKVNGEGEAKEYNIGDTFEKKKVVAYGSSIGDEDKVFVVLNDAMPKSDTLGSISKLTETSRSFDDFSSSVRKLKGLEGADIFSDNDVRFAGLGVLLSDGEVESEYFDKSVVVVKDELVEYYGGEQKEIGGTWAEEALYEEIVLSGKLGKQVTQKKLMDLFLEEYPLSDMAEYVRDMRAKMEGTDYSKSFANVYVGDSFKTISVVDFKAAEEGTKSVSLKVGSSPSFEYSEGKIADMGSSGTLEIRTISPSSINVYFKSKVKDAKGDAVSRSINIKEGESAKFNGIEVSVEDINVKQVAHVTLIPDVKNEKSEADFTFKIGVEQRLIELSPEKAEEMIKNLNESIEKWDNIVNRLGEVVTGLKGACFATSAVLMIKSMATGVSGEAAARSKVMTKYKEICATQYPDKTKTECYNDLSKEIAEDVSIMTGVVSGVNAQMKSVQEGNTVDSGGIFGGESIEDTTKYRNDLKAKIVHAEIPVSVAGEKSEIMVPKERLYSETQIRAVLAWEAASGTGTSEAVLKGEMDDALRNVALAEKSKDEEFSLEKQFIFDDVSLPVSVLTSDQKVFADEGFRIKKEDLKWILVDDSKLDLKNVKDEDIVGAQIVHSGSDDYLYLFDNSGGQLGVYEVESVGGELNIVSKRNGLSAARGVSVKMVSSGDCSNVWNKDDIKISYYESGDNKGLPAIVPFDKNEGWYAMVSNSGGTYIDSSPQGYTASADVRYFKICNIGTNGIMQSGTGDDLCQSFDANTLGEVKDFIPCPKKTPAQVSELYQKARRAIQQASSQYGEKSVNILDEIMTVGPPMGTVGGFECQDFMSPEDCKLMFNVCDPVICPPSRCDFGGKFPVSDVISTGVIGSLVLCLPNAKEGIMMPVCLSGVQAGLDSYVSILESERECLQASIDSGEMIGICDQITSIYKCEFFWRQLSPLMDQMIPGVIDYMIYGSQVRGGGEYMLVEQSWNSMKQSVSYFKDVYAQNAFKAFNIRSTQEIGSTVCKAFVGTSVPGSASFIEDLLAPESPSQFYAQFSEQTFSEATVPATGQYKVYYHIYAGNDEGVQYKVYLKNPPATSYYASNPEIQVDSGYIAQGMSADESKDFTAPSGYKELCVVINAQEECGFKQVTSSFALDYLSDKYVEDQVEDTDIKTEKECISGNPSALSLATLNLQSAANEIVDPEIAMRGIVRVCASDNPDAGVTSGGWVSCSSNDTCATGFYCNSGSYCESKSEVGVMQNSGSKWKDVGYCGDVDLRCWLDVDSVSDALERLEVIDGASISVLDDRRGLIDSGVLDLEGVAALLSKARIDIKELGTGDVDVLEALIIVSELDRVIGTDDASGAGTNGDRAEALALKASVYRLLVGENLKSLASKTEEVRADVVGENNGISEQDLTCENLCAEEGFGAGEDSVDDGVCDGTGYNFDGDYPKSCCCFDNPSFVDSLKNLIGLGEDDSGEAVVGNSDCQVEIGNEIIAIAKDIQKTKGISDASVESDGVADCFEELALMIAMQESDLRHCDDKDQATNCFECGDGFENLLVGSDGRSSGVMGIDGKTHKIDYNIFDTNVRYALGRVLIDWGYNMYKDGAIYDGVSYDGWEAALRAYNGLGSGGDSNYVDNVLEKRNSIEEMFPSVCDADWELKKETAAESSTGGATFSEESGKTYFVPAGCGGDVIATAAVVEGQSCPLYKIYIVPSSSEDGVYEVWTEGRSGGLLSFLRRGSNDLLLGEIDFAYFSSELKDKSELADEVFEDFQISEISFVENFKEWKLEGVGLQLYDAIRAVEMEEDPSASLWIRTKIKSSAGSTAYGPVQLTKGLAEGYLKNDDMGWTEEEREYLNRFIDQGWKFLAHGKMGPAGVVDGKTVSKYESVYDRLGIHVGDKYDARYDYGGVGELTSEEDKILYQKVVSKILVEIYNAQNGDLDRVWRDWRFGREKVDLSISGVDSNYVDERFARLFSEKVKEVGLA